MKCTNLNFTRKGKWPEAVVSLLQPDVDHLRVAIGEAIAAGNSCVGAANLHKELAKIAEALDVIAKD